MAFGPSVIVAGAIVQGVCDSPAEPTYTALVIVPVTGVNVDVPDGARYVQLELVNADAAVIYGAGAPVLSLRGGDLSIPQLVRDYTTGIYCPPTPGSVGPFPTDGDPLPYVELDTTVECRAALTFYLEL
jgi:hypothetical protein